MSITNQIKSLFTNSSNKTIKGRRVTFRKNDGSMRNMLYVELSDMFDAGLLKPSTGPSKNLKEGQKLVWDVEQKGIRTLNEKTIQGSAKTEDVSVSSLK